MRVAHNIRLGFSQKEMNESDSMLSVVGWNFCGITEWSRYEAAIASSEAAAAVDHGRYLSWAASAVMGTDKDAPTALRKPVKFENASKVSVKQVCHTLQCHTFALSML